MMDRETLERIDPVQFNYADRELRQALRTIENWSDLSLPPKPLPDWAELIKHIARMQPEEGQLLLCAVYYGLQGPFEVA